MIGMKARNFMAGNRTYQLMCKKVTFSTFVASVMTGLVSAGYFSFNIHVYIFSS